MSKTNRSYRIRTEIHPKEQFINVDFNQNYDTFEILSLEINQTNSYRLMSSNTGVIVGRVLANGGFGIPNAKVGVFVEYDGSEDINNKLRYLYNSTSDKNDEGIVYNYLPDTTNDDCLQAVGTFPSKRFILDNDDVIEVFDKYYKYTTRTNSSGDYMIYGVPIGTQTLHCDIDLSDIGILSQRPLDMIYKGYNNNLFESPGKFKKDTNLNSLAQIVREDKSIYVYPFWGDTTDNNTGAAITRCDIDIAYKFEPTCIFLGSVITDSGNDAISKKCVPSKEGGKMSKMTTGSGIIEMIRKTITGSIEQVSIQGNEVIDDDGTWCYQIPMNLDYVMTDEYGNTVVSDSPNKGIPTRTSVRFRISLHETPYDGVARKRARYLVPNNPRLVKEDYPHFYKTHSVDYEFGSKTKDENFRDLMWNNVYTIKNYIPRIQKTKYPNVLKFTGIKMVNHPEGNNPMPYNKLSIKFNFIYTFLCILIKTLVRFVGLINLVVSSIGYFCLLIADLCCSISYDLDGTGAIAKWFFKKGNKNCKEYINANAAYCGARNTTGQMLQAMWAYTSHCKNTLEGNYFKGLDLTINNYGGLGWFFVKLGVALSHGITLSGLCETDEGDSVDITPGLLDRVKTIFSSGTFSNGSRSVKCPNLKDANINTNMAKLFNCVENQLAQENEVTSFNFFNDWVNGVLYMPLWFRRIRHKTRFFGLFTIQSKDEWCDSSKKSKSNIRLYSNCVLKREVQSGGISSLSDDYPTVNVSKSIADDETGYEAMKFYSVGEKNCYGFKCHQYGRFESPINTGLIHEQTTMLGDHVYYYRPTYYNTKYNKDLTTLFATDIVLLGSINSHDLHGIPQFFKILEGTSYQMPPDLLSESFEYKTNDDGYTDETDKNYIDEATRITEFTGADWGDLGVDQSNYKQGYREANENIYDNGGLFYGLTCFDSYVKPKSIINLERVCEIGVSLDVSKQLLKSNLDETNYNEDDEDSNYTQLTPDGYISYDEIINPDYRSMFVTLNNNFLKTKVNTETGLVEYDLTHLYTDNFDGSLYKIMKGQTTQGNLVVDGDRKPDAYANYRNNYKLEIQDENYLKFRFGNYVKKNGNYYYYYDYNGKITNLFLTSTNNGSFVTIKAKDKQPRYENSFYFYFGLKIGKTAIDKFYSKYYADCGANVSYDKPFEIEYVGNGWCDGDNPQGYVKFDCSYELPLSITIIDKEDNKSYAANNINTNKFYVGYKYCINDNCEHSYVVLHNENNEEVGNIFVNDKEYQVTITDVDGNTYTDSFLFTNENKITCDFDRLDFNVTNEQLLDLNDTTRLYKVTGDGKPDIYAYDIPYAFLGSTTYDTSGMQIDGRGFTYYGEIKIVNGYEKFVSAVDDTGRAKYTYQNGILRDKNNPLNIITFDRYDGVNYYDINSNALYVEYYEYLDINVGKTSTYRYKNGYDNIEISDVINPVSYQAVANIGVNNIANRTMLGYIMVSNVSEPNFQIDVTTSIPNLIPGYSGESDSDGCHVKVVNGLVTSTGYGYLGVSEDYKTYYIGVPLGNVSYKVTITMLCVEERGYQEPITHKSENKITSHITVYEGFMRMFINGIDYDIIKNFRTGWSNLLLNDINSSEFDKLAVKGWNEVNKIGLKMENLKLPIKPNLTDNPNESDETSKADIDQIGELLMTNLRLLRLPIGDNSNTINYSDNTRYNWVNDYLIDKVTWNSLGDSDEDYLTKANLINNVISKRIDFTKQVQGAFRPNMYGTCEITLSVETNSKPVKYLIVNDLNIQN